MTDSDGNSSRPKSRGFSFLLLAALCVVVALIYHKVSQPGTAEAQAPRGSVGVSAQVSALSGGTFQQSIASGVHVVDFWAEWCGPCRTQAPIMENLAKRYGGKASVGKVDVDAEGGLAERFKVRSIPTIIVFKDGREAARFVGVTDENELAATVNRML